MFALIALALLTIEGGATPVALSAADLAALPRVSVDWRNHGKSTTCSGAWLADLVARAGAPTGDAVRGPALTMVVVAAARDGYRAAFTLGELDRKLGSAPIIVADRCDGVPLATADGPLRVVAAADERGARSVRQLVKLTLIQP